jgi:predicted amidophosphoribosyltransferase
MHRPGPTPTPPGLDRCLALLSYAGAGRELIARLKYRNSRASVRWLAVAMAALVDEPVDVVTWIPTTPLRRRERGFDQAELLARAVARTLRRPCARLLVRGAGPPQTGADAFTRRYSRPKLSPVRAVAGSLVMVDDVMTTGATLTAAAHTLRGAGANRVIGLVAARTPPPGDLH